jgi:hypothetical protein
LQQPRHNFDQPPFRYGMHARSVRTLLGLASAFQRQRLHNEAGLDVANLHSSSSVSAVVDDIPSWFLESKPGAKPTAPGLDRPVNETPRRKRLTVEFESTLEKVHSSWQKRDYRHVSKLNSKLQDVNVHSWLVQDMDDLNATDLRTETSLTVSIAPKPKCTALMLKPETIRAVHKVQQQKSLRPLQSDNEPEYRWLPKEQQHFYTKYVKRTKSTDDAISIYAPAFVTKYFATWYNTALSMFPDYKAITQFPHIQVIVRTIPEEYIVIMHAKQYAYYSLSNYRQNDFQYWVVTTLYEFMAMAASRRHVKGK